MQYNQLFNHLQNGEETEGYSRLSEEVGRIPFKIKLPFLLFPLLFTPSHETYDYALRHVNALLLHRNRNRNCCGRDVGLVTKTEADGLIGQVQLGSQAHPQRWHHHTPGRHCPPSAK